MKNFESNEATPNEWRILTTPSEMNQMLTCSRDNERIAGNRPAGECLDPAQTLPKAGDALESVLGSGSVAHDSPDGPAWFGRPAEHSREPSVGFPQRTGRPCPTPGATEA